MESEQWISAAAAVLYLALGALAVLRGGRSPLAAPLALLCVSFFAYDTLEVVRTVTDDPIWDALDRAAAALVAPPTLLLVATFVGMRRALRVPLAIASAYFVALAGACVAAAAIPELRWLATNDSWALWMLGGMAPTFGAIPFVVAWHARRSGPEERARTQLFSLALVLGVGSITSELFAIAGAGAPRVAAFGITLSVVLLGALALRARVLERLSGLAIVNALALASVAVLGHVVVLELFGDRTVLVVFGAVALTLALLAALRPMVVVIAEERARTRHLAMLGRFSAQMAHDLKNPLAAIRGAAQYLTEEGDRGGSIRDHRAFLDMILEQSDRLAHVVDEYQRLGRVEAVCAPVDLARIAREVATAQRAAEKDPRVAVSSEVRGDAIAELSLDRDLVLGALENLVRNAREALAERGTGGRVAIVVEPREREVSVRVEDDGPGMDPRTRERAFDEFYTTKATGSGLGLALVSRVARAHGGRASIRSDEGRGTVVEIVLPRGRESSP